MEFNLIVRTYFDLYFSVRPGQSSPDVNARPVVGRVNRGTESPHATEIAVTGRLVQLI